MEDFPLSISANLPANLCSAWEKGDSMIKKVFIKKKFRESSPKDDLSFWLRKTEYDRVATVDFLRRQYHGSTAGLQRVARVVQRSQS